MKILFLSDANSSHTIKWVNGLAEHGVLIHLMTLSTLDKNLYAKTSNVTVESFNLTNKISNLREDKLFKIKYI